MGRGGGGEVRWERRQTEQMRLQRDVGGTKQQTSCNSFWVWKRMSDIRHL